jgi:hypothetical protein
MDNQGYNFGSVGSGFDSWLGHFFYFPTNRKSYQHEKELYIPPYETTPFKPHPE